MALGGWYNVTVGQMLTGGDMTIEHSWLASVSCCETETPVSSKASILRNGNFGNEEHGEKVRQIAEWETKKKNAHADVSSVELESKRSRKPMEEDIEPVGDRCHLE